MIKKINDNKKIIIDSIDGQGEQLVNPVQNIIDKYNIDTKIWYAKSFKIKDGMWNSAAIKRDQDLVWKREEDSEGNPQQIMTGYSKRYPEFMLAENKTFKIEILFERLPIEINILEEYKELISKLPKIRPIKQQPKRVIKNGIAVEIATVDAHLGKLAWEKETGYRNYDLDIAVEDYRYISEEGLDYATMHKPEQIYKIIGNDMYHMDNMAGRTTNGEHTLDVDGRVPKVHEKAFLIERDNIYNARKLAPVKVIWIPGNHDFLSSYMLVFALKEHFRHDSKITFDLGKNARKAILWGNLLVGWNHAIKGKYSVWVNELPQQFPELWGQSKFREWHCGDQHKKVTTKIVTPVNTIGGVTIRQLTALSPVDKWHTDNTFTDAIPGGELLVWSKDVGIFANYTLWIGQYPEHRNKIIENHKSK